MAGCPCGASVKAGYQNLEYMTEELLEAVIGSKWGVAAGLFVAWVGQALNLEDLCSSTKAVAPTEMSPLWFVQPYLFLDQITLWLRNKAYEYFCDCDDCPPVTGCNTGVSLILPGDFGSPREGFEDIHYEYRINSGTVYAQRSDGQCYGPYTGIVATRVISDGFDPNLGVTVESYPSGTASGWAGVTYGQGMTLWLGGNDPGQGVDPGPTIPDGTADWLQPEACITDTTTITETICENLDWLKRAVRRIEFLTSVTAGPIYGVTADYTWTPPGVITPVVGTLSEWLPRALAALAPVTPSQLEVAATSPVTTTGTVTVTGAAYLTVELADVPAYHGHWGDEDTLIYHSRSRSPAPGYGVLLGQSGVLGEYRFVYGAGTEIVIPPTATDLAIHLEPGVQITVTKYTRDV